MITISRALIVVPVLSMPALALRFHSALIIPASPASTPESAMAMSLKAKVLKPTVCARCSLSRMATSTRPVGDDTIRRTIRYTHTQKARLTK